MATQSKRKPQQQKEAQKSGDPLSEIIESLSPDEQVVAVKGLLDKMLKYREAKCGEDHQKFVQSREQLDSLTMLINPPQSNKANQIAEKMDQRGATDMIKRILDEFNHEEADEILSVIINITRSDRVQALENAETMVRIQRDSLKNFEERVNKR